jgi:hypothetical protein
MRRGHVSLPNGLGVRYPDGDGLAATGVAPNELTGTEDRDPFVGTPWHKHVPARIERESTRSSPGYAGPSYGAMRIRRGK